MMDMKDSEVFEQTVSSAIREFLNALTPQERLEGLRPEERLEGLRPEERLEAALHGLSPEQQEQIRLIVKAKPT